MRNSTTTRLNKILSRGGAVVFWLCVWQLLSMLIRQQLFIASPLATIQRLLALLGERAFWAALGNTFLHISAGFLAAVMAGVLLAALAAQFTVCRSLLRPFMSAAKATPVASFIILALILMGSRHLAALISFLIVLPVLFINTLTGIDSIDRSMFEAADVFGMLRRDRLRYIYLPETLPYILSGCSVGMGLAWKSGVAAEVIGLSANTVGEQLYQAKIFLNTADVFAYTLVIIAVSITAERFFDWLVRRLSDRLHD